MTRSRPVALPAALVPWLLAVALLGACQDSNQPESLVFALVPKAMNNPFFDQARDGCKQAGRELDVECLYIGPGEHTEQEQIQIVDDLITRRVDGIAVSPSNAPAMARALRRAGSVGIPVITWDSDLLSEDRELRATYIGTHNRQIGVEQAKLLQELKPDGGTLCIQSGGPAAFNHNQRMQGIRDTLSGSDTKAPPGTRLDGAGGWIEVDGCPLYCNDDFTLAVQQLADVLGRYSELDALIVTGGFPQFVDQAYRQLMERHRERIESRSTVVIVADTLPMQMALLKEGWSHGQVGQRPFEMGRRALYVLRDLVLQNGTPNDPIYTGLDVCTQENASECLATEE